MKKIESPPSVPPSAGGTDSLEELFERARGDGFSREDMNELWNRTGAAVAPGIATPHGGAGTAAGATPVGVAGFSIKTIAALVMGGLVVAGGVSQLPTASHDVTRAPAGVTTPAQASPPDSPAPVLDSPGPSARAIAVADLPAVTDSPHAQPKTHGPAGAEGREGPRWAPAQRSVETGEPAPGPAIERTTPPGGPSALAPFPGSARQEGDGPVAALTSAGPTEGALLLQARRQLASDPAGALALTMEDARRFPAGTLAPEREVLAIEALARLGRTSEARQRLDAFKQRFPQSPHVARLDGLIARQER